jgi:glycosyltransferase A (GT-A) superfamily protein (DUF2064 family)
MTHAPGRTILLFTRAPEVEARAKGLPVKEGSRLFTGFLKSWRQRAAEAGANLLVITPHSSEGVLTALLPGAPVATQSGSSFADRLDAAFALAFRRGANAVLLVGGDSPPLDSTEIQEAFRHLESRGRAMVLAPSSDGGVNAIGLTARTERSLAAISWGSRDVCQQLQAEAARLGLALLRTAVGHDLDCAGNVAILYRLSRGAPGWRAFRWLLLSVCVACRPAQRRPVLPAGRVARPVRFTRGPPCFCLSDPQDNPVCSVSGRV